MAREPRLTADPLSEITRTKRTYVLALATAGYLIHRFRLYPTKISAFGIDFPADQIPILLSTVGVALAFFWLSFCVYAWADVLEFLRKKTQYLDERLGFASKGVLLMASLSRHLDNETEERLARIREIRGYWFLRIIRDFDVWIRLLLDFAVPLIFGAYVMCLLFFAPITANVGRTQALIVNSVPSDTHPRTADNPANKTARH
jgi:hypothetical protein